MLAFPFVVSLSIGLRVTAPVPLRFLWARSNVSDHHFASGRPTTSSSISAEQTRDAAGDASKRRACRVASCPFHSLPLLTIVLVPIIAATATVIYPWLWIFASPLLSCHLILLIFSPRSVCWRCSIFESESRLLEPSTTFLGRFQDL